MDQLFKVKFNNSQNNLGFEIRSLESIYKLPNFDTFESSHQITFYCIILITHGKGEHQINFNSYNFSKGSLFFVSRNQVQAFRHSKSAKGYVVLFNEDFLNQNQLKFNDLSYSYPFNFGLYNTYLQVGNRFNQLNDLFNYIYQEYKSPVKEETEELLQCLLRSILLKIKSNSKKELLRNSTLNNSSKLVFIQFQQLLDKNIGIRNANFFCRELKISYNQLNNILKKETGYTIKVFIDKNLMLKAKQLLLLSRHNISEIAILLGFNEATNFTKFFKNLANKSPSEFQKSLKSN